MLYGKYIEEYWAEEKVGAELLEITMRPLVYTYYIRFEFEEGIEHVVKACGSIAGMAEKVYLHDGHTGEEAATVLYDCRLGKTYVDANVMLQDGIVHDPIEGQCFQRMCLPCARSVLETACRRIAADFEDVK